MPSPSVALKSSIMIVSPAALKSILNICVLPKYTVIVLDPVIVSFGLLYILPVFLTVIVLVVAPLENNKGWIRELAAELRNTMITPLTEFTREATTTNITNNMYNELVTAFKDALSQMKVTLDDEELGNFVEKTVADAIYI